MPDWPSSLLDLLLPRQCGGCSRPGMALCDPCADDLAGLEPTRVPPGVVACADPSGVGRAAVRAHKLGGQSELAGPLAAILARCVAAALVGDGGGWPEPLVLVPVPQRRSARRERGANTVEDIARRAAHTLPGAVTVAPVLRLRRQPADQRGLGAEERRTNVVGSMVAAWPPRGVVIVVDDVVTTGATLVEAVRALTAAGSRVRGCAAVVATPSPALR